MPASYWIDSDFNVVFGRAWGTLTDSDLIERQRQIRDDPDFLPNMNELFDFSDVERIELTSNGIWALADRSLFGVGSKRAFCIEPGATVIFDMMRMFQNLTEDHADELRVQFNSLERARSWLGLPKRS